MNIKRSIKDLQVSNSDGKIVLGYLGEPLLVDLRTNDKHRDTTINSWNRDHLLKVIRATTTSELKQGISKPTLLKVKKWFNDNINNLEFIKEETCQPLP